MLKIEEISGKTEVSVETLRYYDKLGLFNFLKLRRTQERHNIDDIVQVVNFIKKAQALRFSLSDIRQILATHEQDNATRQTARALLDAKIQDVSTQIKHLHEFKAELEIYRDCLSEEAVNDSIELPLDGSAMEIPLLSDSRSTGDSILSKQSSSRRSSR
jgi:DNA-binding transcriptional MerR regulator